ncbi:hypothetical protein HRR83_002475 [Exophiala dermatitidis]|uniref:Uncharacterized protein n=1 Tax=Exophiala dermatitidis TaxID=5970 RepID=A0AAN6EVP4_EXODE|nr:hypothetical protein HRR74_002552 [Exophiala dermatitidis]KAJ4525373.1 hypothetical protein HRR73_002102 [Exophiala dermatitidis]KAJ4536686.1 hypothetical protein HRR76_004714 [Exophiala dermatitidis]KAJ4569012.1 hypothetical protein HRR81_006670 [Exophiala dermatitidis]KAJ4586678.1 hypothetical protein HRR82_002295 [Exophiala dermatitidis]
MRHAGRLKLPSLYFIQSKIRLSFRKAKGRPGLHVMESYNSSRIDRVSVDSIGVTAGCRSGEVKLHCSVPLEEASLPFGHPSPGKACSSRRLRTNREGGPPLIGMRRLSMPTPTPTPVKHPHFITQPPWHSGYSQFDKATFRAAEGPPASSPLSIICNSISLASSALPDVPAAPETPFVPAL